MKIYIDFETYSPVDITVCGTYNHIHADGFMIVCCGYAVDEGAAAVWTPFKASSQAWREVLNQVAQGAKVYGHGLFDLEVWNFAGAEHFGWPRISIDNYIDTMALAGTYTLPLSLDKIGQALNLPLKKLKSGKTLITKCCKPNKQGKQPRYNDYPQTFEELFAYCRRDVETMRQFVNLLPRQDLIPQEKKIWKISLVMNRAGLPIDSVTADNILKRYTQAASLEVAKLPALTRGTVATAGQIQKILDFCKAEGCELPNLQADTVNAALDDPKTPDTVRQVLQIREYIGRSSVKKYEVMRNHVTPDGTIKYLLQFHGASTGRWAGRGLQLHNLPRAKVKDPDAVIEDINSGKPIDDIFSLAKALIRPMIYAQDPYTFVVLDYSSIENVLLLWAAQDANLEVFRKGLDPYKDMAAYFYGKSYDAVNTNERQFGKVLVLGCGYGMAWKRLKETANSYGLDLADKEAQDGVQAWRAKHNDTVSWWYSMHNAAKRAVITGDLHVCNAYQFKRFTKNGLSWLGMKLPSGKAIYYANPRLEDDTYGVTLVHDGVNPYTKKWSSLKVSPGRLVENAIQATAREVLCQGKINVVSRYPDISICCSVHDEIIAVVHKEYAEQAYKDLETAMCDVPWCLGAPLRASGYIANRYKKE